MSSTQKTIFVHGRLLSPTKLKFQCASCKILSECRTRARKKGGHSSCNAKCAPSFVPYSVNVWKFQAVSLPAFYAFGLHVTPKTSCSTLILFRLKFWATKLDNSRWFLFLVCICLRIISRDRLIPEVHPTQGLENERLILSNPEHSNWLTKCTSLSPPGMGSRLLIQSAASLHVTNLSDILQDTWCLILSRLPEMDFHQRPTCRFQLQFPQVVSSVAHYERKSFFFAQCMKWCLAFHGEKGGSHLLTSKIVSWGRQKNTTKGQVCLTKNHDSGPRAQHRTQT